MKRALIVLLLLAVAGGLFAQVTFSGYVRSGLEVAIPDEGDPTFHLYNADVGNRWRFQLGATYTNADGNAGAGATIRTNNDGLGAVAWGHDNAYAWAKPLDVVLLRFGSGPGGFGSMGGFDGHVNVADGQAFHTVFGPFAGLSLGLSIQPNNVQLADSQYSFGVKYAASGLMTAVADLRYNGAGNDGDGKADFIAGFNFLGLASAGLTTLAVDVTAEDLTEEVLWIGVGPRIGFQVNNIAAGNLTGQLRSKIWLPMGDNDNDMNFAVYAQAGVPVVTGITVSLGAGYEAKADLKALTASGAIDHRVDFDGLRSYIPNKLETSILLISPSVTFANIGGAGGASLQAGWSFQTQLGDDAKTQNAIFALFNVGF